MGVFAGAQEVMAAAYHLGDGVTGWLTRYRSGISNRSVHLHAVLTNPVGYEYFGYICLLS